MDAIRPGRKGGAQAHRTRRVRRRPGRTPLGVLVRHPQPDVSLDTLVLGGATHPMEQDLRILPVPVDRSGDEERITAVSTKAAAGYAEGFGDPEWVSALPTFDLPLPGVPRDRTLRFFQIEGDSMLPIPSGSWILCTYVERRRTWAAEGHTSWPRRRTDSFKRVENRMDWKGPLDGLQQSGLRVLRHRTGRSQGSVARDWLVLNRLAGRIRRRQPNATD